MRDVGYLIIFEIVKLDHCRHERLKFARFLLRQGYPMSKCANRTVLMVLWQRVERVAFGSMLPVRASGGVGPLDS